MNVVELLRRQVSDLQAICDVSARERDNIREALGRVAHELRGHVDCRCGASCFQNAASKIEAALAAPAPTPARGDK